MGTFEKIRSTLEELIGRFAATTAINALKNGVIATLPLTMLGSIFLLISSFPISNWNDIMTSILGPDWQYPFTQVSSNTFDIIAMASAGSIGYQYAKLKGVEPFSCGLIALVNFLVLIPSIVTGADGAEVTGVISKTWSGGSGMATAIVVGLVTGWIYTSVLARGWRIKMPASVPTGVADTFSALIPGFLSIVAAFVVCLAMRFGLATTLAEFLESLLQAPLQIGLGSLPGLLVLTLLISLFWMFGIHSSVINSIANPILRANGLANQALLDAGMALTAANGAFMVTYQTRSNFITMSGACCTIGLVLAMAFLARSKQYKSLGRLALVPSFFNVNEPVLFGFPIVLNFRMIVPVFLVPIAAALMTYFACFIGFVQPFAAIEVPWTTPPLISGFILAGWQGLVLQVAIIIVSFLGYYPFFRAQDKEAFEAETADEAEPQA